MLSKSDFHSERCFGIMARCLRHIPVSAAAHTAVRRGKRKMRFSEEQENRYENTFQPEQSRDGTIRGGTTPYAF